MADSKKGREEWESQGQPESQGESNEVPKNYVAPDAGARNEWNSWETRNWQPKQYWSLPVDKINLDAGGDNLKAKALDALAGRGSKAPAEAKPGEPLPSDSGYHPKFIEDYNKFQEQYKARH